MSYNAYPFHLTPDEEARSKALHDESIIIDLLYQGPLTTLNYPTEIADKAEAMVENGTPAMQAVLFAMYEPSAAAARGELAAFGEAWLASGVTGGNRQILQEPAEFAWMSYSIAQAQFDRCEWMIKALKAEDFRRAKAHGKAAGYVSTQQGPGAKLEDIENGYRLGLRMIQLTYNSLTSVGAGCTERTDAGVSLYGQKCIEKMNELGIIVDTGHCGRQTTLDACALSSQPVVASHTAVNALRAHDRCKSDEEIRAIAETGGVVGIATVPFFLAAGEATIEDFLNHIDYVKQLVGGEHWGIGSDCPLAVPAKLMESSMLAMTADLGFRKEHKIEPLATITGFETYLDFPNITRGLVSRGYSDEEVKAVLGGNVLRVFEAVCG